MILTIALMKVWIILILTELVAGDCKAKLSIPNQLQFSYPSNHCYRGGVSAWISYTYFPPCWIYINNQWHCYEYDPTTPGKCPPWKGIRNMHPN